LDQAPRSMALPDPGSRAVRGGSNMKDGEDRVNDDVCCTQCTTGATQSDKTTPRYR
jgi:hypothetical protein